GRTHDPNPVDRLFVVGRFLGLARPGSGGWTRLFDVLCRRTPRLRVRRRQTGDPRSRGPRRAGRLSVLSRPEQAQPSSQLRRDTRGIPLSATAYGKNPTRQGVGLSVPPRVAGECPCRQSPPRTTRGRRSDAGNANVTDAPGATEQSADAAPRVGPALDGGVDDRSSARRPNVPFDRRLGLGAQGQGRAVSGSRIS